MTRNKIIIGSIVLLTLCCGFSLMIGIFMLAPTPDQRSGTAAAPVDQEPAAVATADQVDVQYHVGQNVQVGKIRWRVLEAINVGQTLNSDNEFQEPLQTNGKFIRVRFELENLSSDPIIFSDVNIIDAQQRKFQNHSEAAVFFADNKEFCALEQLNPNVPKTCTMVFELPADAAGLHLLVGDLNMFSAQEASINLNLN